MPEVTVALKHPNGIILRLFEMVETQEPVMGGGFRTFKLARQKGPQVRINGNAHPQDKAPLQPLAGNTGFALTYGIDKAFWDEWLAQNKDTDLVKNGLIFAHEKESNTTAQAKAHASLKSGLERMDPDNLPKLSDKVTVKKAEAVA